MRGPLQIFFRARRRQLTFEYSQRRGDGYMMRNQIPDYVLNRGGTNIQLGVVFREKEAEVRTDTRLFL